MLPGQQDVDSPFMWTLICGFRDGVSRDGKRPNIERLCRLRFALRFAARNRCFCGGDFRTPARIHHGRHRDLQLLGNPRQLIPSFRNWIASSRRNTRRGRPRILPFALAAFTPATVRSRINSRSIAEKALMITKRKRDIGLLSSVSMFDLDEPNAQRIKLQNALVGFEHRPAPPIQFPNEHGVEPALPGVVHEAGEFGAIGFRSLPS
jgi:hypothetical protein